VINSALGAVPLQTYFTTPTPTLTWNRISNATRYEVQVANNPLFNFATTRDAGNNLSLTWPIALKDGIYFWHVRACISASASSCSVWSAWSAYDSFVIDVP
jgi:hypothetical protein